MKAKIAEKLIPNSKKYAEIAKNYGAEVPFIRPNKISQDTSTDKDFLIHAMQWLKKNEGTIPEYWVHLRPTTPLRDPNIINCAIDKLSKNRLATALRSGHKTPESPLKWFIKREGYFKGIIENENYNLPKEMFEQVYIPDLLAIASFYKGKLAENIGEIQESVQYTPEFFDEIEEEVLKDETTLEEAMGEEEEEETDA